MKPVKDEPKIPVELRPDQLADIIDAVLAFADDCANDREILQSMPRVDRDTVEDLLQRESALQTLAAWLQHVQEEAKWIILRRACGPSRRPAAGTARTEAAHAAQGAAPGRYMRASGTTSTTSTTETWTACSPILQRESRWSMPTTR